MSNNFEKSSSKDPFSTCKEGYSQSSSIALLGAKNKRIDTLGLTAIFPLSLRWENFPVFAKNNDTLVDFDLKFARLVDKPLVHQNRFIVFASFGSSS